MSDPTPPSGDSQDTGTSDVPQGRPRQQPRTIIGITAPLVIAGIVAALWFTDHFDSLLTRAGAPGLTHACVNANSSIDDGLRCLVYKAESRIPTVAAATPTSTSTTPSTASLPQTSRCFYGSAECYLATCTTADGVCTDPGGRPIAVTNDLRDNALNCTWRDEGQNADHSLERYQCQLPNTGSTPSPSDAARGRCGTVFIGPNPQDIASGIHTAGTSCTEARALALRSRDPGATFDARPSYTAGAFSCAFHVSTPVGGGESSLDYVCTSAGASVTFVHH